MADAGQHQLQRRPITSHMGGGDRLPSRASKTRDKTKRIHIGGRKINKNQQQGKLKKDMQKHESMSPKNRCVYEVNSNHYQRQSLHTAIPNKKFMSLEDLNNENAEPDNNCNFKFRGQLRKKDIIIEEDEEIEDAEKYSQKF